MRPFIILFSILLISACSQPKLSYGPIISDPAFSCSDTSLLENYCKVVKLCESKNDLEIRLEVIYAPSTYFSLYVLTNSHNYWTATKYSKTFNYTTKDGSILIDSNKIFLQNEIKKAFDTLKINKAFSLPNQSDLKIVCCVDDGTIYTLSFKVGDKFRKYGFDNPDYYQDKFAQIKEVKNYFSIAQTFTSLFDKK